MKLGHQSLLLAFLLVLGACQKEAAQLKPTERAGSLSRAMRDRDWPLVQKLSANSPDGLHQLVYQYALFQSEEFKEVLEFPLMRSMSLRPYQIYLHSLSAFEAEDWAEVLKFELPESLPLKLEAQIALAQGRALKKLQRPEEARKELLNYLKTRPTAPFRGDFLLEVADIEWELDLKQEALKRYKSIYELFPIVDSDDQARTKLTDNNLINQIETETHLQRIQKLRRAAQFQRAERELSQLLKVADNETKEKIQLAQVELSFARREYSRSFQLAKTNLTRKLAPEFEVEWRNILGWSLIRLGKSVEGRAEYQKLLKLKLPDALRESVLYRLGVTCMDDDAYQEAADTFKNLREKYARGKYQESSHWFEAWSLFQAALRETPINESKLKSADKLLGRLPFLEAGQRLKPQSLYWQMRTAEELKNKERAKALRDELTQKWKLSFFNLLINENGFSFLKEFATQSATNASSTKSANENTFQQREEWQRLEAFRSVHLMDWAQLEMARFLRMSNSNSLSFRKTVAERLRSIEDWADLVRWSENHFDKDLNALQDDRATLEFLYPRSHEFAVLKGARQFKVSPFLAWGLMREESRFESDVRSHAGAEGLMQIMPSQSARIAGELGERIPVGGMFDPDRNIRYGIYHLKELQSQVANLAIPPELRPIVVVAAYNAGLEPVRKWLAENDTSRIDTFVESIPYSETRQYVKRVLQSASIYFRLYGLKGKGNL